MNDAEKITKIKEFLANLEKEIVECRQILRGEKESGQEITQVAIEVDRVLTIAPIIPKKQEVKASCPPAGVVLDPFAGSGTALAVAKKLGRKVEVANAFLKKKARRFLWKK